MSHTPKPPVEIPSSKNPSRITPRKIITDRPINSKAVENAPAREWISKLPLVDRLSHCLRSENLSDIAALSPQEIAEASRVFCAEFESFLTERIAALKNALLLAQDSLSNPKFNIYHVNFGSVGDFHKPLHEEVGSPNADWLQGLTNEHVRNTDMFKSVNFDIETTPADELAHVFGDQLPKDTHMGHGRRLQSVDVLLQLEESVRAGLTRAEIIALQLYTGPMYQIYNTILRRYPVDKYEQLRDKDSLFPTTICVLVSAVQKLARAMVIEPGTVLYRGIDGNMELPTRFFTPDENGCLGVMEYGFMSTTSDWQTALSYARGCLPKIIAIVVGAVDRGADISKYSQYPGEREFLWVPHSFLEPIGGSELRITDKGVVQVVGMKVNANQKAFTIEQYERLKMDLHLGSFKVLVQDLQIELNNVS
jgi:hypothetical protein